MLLRAIEDKTFFPVGSDKEVHSDFQLIAGTNRDLSGRIVSGQFREDLLARINLWTFQLPGLRERPEDIEPNLEFELERVGDDLKQRLTLSRDAQRIVVSRLERAGALRMARVHPLQVLVALKTYAQGHG